MNKSLIKSTGIVAFSTLLSRILGLVREMVIAGIFGASKGVDAFIVAFRIPNLFRRFVAEGCLTISFIPIYTDYLVNKGREEALKLAQKTLSILLILLTIIVASGIIFSPQLVRLMGFGFTDPVQISLTISLNRILFPYLFFVTIVAFAMGYLNSNKYFFAPAFSPVLLNVGFIVCILLLRHFLHIPIYSIAIGGLAGGVLQLLCQIPYMIKAGFRLKISIDLKHPGLRAIGRMMLPALFGIAVYQINIFMSTMLASMLPEGSITYIYFSDRLTELVFGVFIFSISNVILPALSEHSASGDWEKVKSLYVSSVKTVLLPAIPAAIALIALGIPIISVLFMRGKFSADDVHMLNKALIFACLGIPATSIVRMTVQAFYAIKNTKIPVIASTVSFLINIGMGYILMQTRLIHGGLTLALSIAVTAQMIVLIYFLRKMTGRLGFKSIFLSLIKYIISGLAMGICVWYASGFVDWIDDLFIKRIIFLAGIIAGGGGLYLFMCHMLKVDEINFVIKMLLKKIRK